MIDVHWRKPALIVMPVPERKLLASMRRAEGVIDVEDNGSMRAAHSRAASVLRRVFSKRQMVDCEASAPPLCGQRPTASFIKGS
jgi:hypothetical protein